MNKQNGETDLQIQRTNMITRQNRESRGLGGKGKEIKKYKLVATKYSRGRKVQHSDIVKNTVITMIAPGGY